MRISILFTLLVTSLAASAATVVWTNTSGGNWTVATNWSPNQVPGASDTAIITNDGTYTLSLSANASVLGLVLDGTSGTQTLAAASGTLTFYGPGYVGTNGVLALNGGSIGGTNLVTVAGALQWNGGTIGSSAGVQIAGGGALSIAGTGAKTLSGSLANAGVATFAPEGGSYLNLNGTLHNQAGGTFDLRNDALFNYGGGGAQIVNEGLFIKSAGTGTNILEVDFNNRGTMQVDTGHLQLTSGGTWSTGASFVGAGSVTVATVGPTLDGAVLSSNVNLYASLSGAGTLAGVWWMWSGGMSSGSRATIATNGELHWLGTLQKTFSGSLTNAGRIVYAASGAGRAVLNGPLHNLPGGMIEFQNDLILDYGGAGALFVNEGLLWKSAGPGTNDCQVKFQNRGQVQVDSGGLEFSQGGNLHDGGQFIGSGQALLTANTFDLDGTTVSSNLVLAGGTLGNTGSVAGAWSWTSGGIGSGAAVTVTTNGQLTLLGTAVKNLLGWLTNAGTITYAAPSSGYLNAQGKLYNLPGALFDFQCDSQINYGSSGCLLVNGGVLRKSSGTGTNQVETAFVNSGTVDVQTGAIEFRYGGTLESGSAFTGAGRAILAVGTFNLSGSLFSQSLVLDGASLNGAGNFTGSLVWNSGTISASLDLFIPVGGTLWLTGSGAKTVNGSILNAGTIVFASANQFTMGGTILHNQPGGLFDIQVDQTINYGGAGAQIINEGTIRKSAGLGTCTNEIATLNSGNLEALSGTILFKGTFNQTLAGALKFNLGGTNTTSHGHVDFGPKPTFNGSLCLRFDLGYVPAAGDRFTVMRFPSRDGDFKCYNGFLLLGENRRLVPSWTSTNLTLVATDMPDPLSPTLSIAKEDIVLLCWPGEFLGYNLQANTNLNTTNWAPVLVNDPGRLPLTPALPEAYFRLRKP